MAPWIGPSAFCATAVDQASMEADVVRGIGLGVVR